MTQQPFQLRQFDDARRRAWRSAAGGVAVVAAIFAVIVSIVLLREMIRDLSEHPLEAAYFVKMQEQLADSPGDEQFKQRIREEDLRIRQTYFARRAFVQHGAFLLAGGLVVLVLSIKSYYKLAERPPMPSAATPATPSVSAARWAVGAGGLASAAVLMLVAFLPGAPPPMGIATSAAGGDGSPVPVPAKVAITDELRKQNWTAFRGYGGSARAIGEYPTEFDGETGKNILWKSPIPLQGRNSPIVWGDRVFISGATPTKREVYCYDANTGEQLWKQTVSQSAQPSPPDLMEGTDYAPNTLATDGERVYAIFPSGDVVAYDFNGKRLWGRSFGEFDNIYGHATSLLTWQDRLIVQIDQAYPEDKKSAIHALDGATGREIWRMPRPVESSWASPILIETESGPQIVAPGHPFVIAYEPETGKEIWRADGMAGEVAPSPFYQNGVVYAGVERADLLAIPVNEKGDVTDKILWEQPDDLPDIVSLIASEKHVLTITSGGRVVAFRTEDGEFGWEHEFEEARFDASPIFVGDVIYLADKTKGDVIIFRPADKYEEIARCSLGEPLHATPAFVNGRIYIRSDKHLYCIGTK